MLIDGRRVANGSTLHADVCIVGGGPAGLALADSLVGCGRRVLLLEAGGARDIDSVEALELETSGEPLEPLGDSRWRQSMATARRHGSGVQRASAQSTGGAIHPAEQ